jgi:tRNA A37 methylthiotransferase MiaB
LVLDVALTSDFIVGFCGETEAEHKETVSLVREIPFSQSFTFAYSMREKTHAHRTMQ